ncbi:zinc finger BED domain-containing protein RICESLEEPER 2-like [Cucumis melo var. makuwa]|uniref:Zinc finger BED domain-containing protein RICESLEEPER 2-like n=1 Tax=Cucumis melo var. makuwa TaxID=1194695 RepID=A0A5A7UE50_CUCMM|nr:zinc finger BED domain-containing protein RICESLEEPER 2-like [Cucumis melo var. makuwa]
MDSTDIELECDGSCETSKIVRDEDTNAKRKTIDVDSYGREDVPNPSKIRKNVKQSMVWDHFERLKGGPNDPRAKCDTIGKTIEKNLKDWGIERVMTLTVDNASSNDTAVAYLLKRFNKGLLFGGEFLHVRCCAHILNLIVTDAFKEHNDHIDRIRYVVRFIRWNSTYMMLEAAVKFEKAFDRLEDEDASYRHDMSPNKEDWTNARIANTLLVGMANNMKTKFEKYWGNNEKNNLLLYVAIVLDPRKKLRFVSFCLKNVFGPEVAESMGNVVEQYCRRLFHEYSTTRSGSRQGCSSISTTSTQTVSSLDANIDFDSNENVGEDFVYDTIVKEFEGDATTPFEQGSSEIDIYLLEANVMTEVSTVASESAFSTEGRVVDSSRCSLAPKTVEALICTQNWLNSDPIHLQIQHELEEASKFEEGFRVVMENEKELKDLPDFDKPSSSTKVVDKTRNIGQTHPSQGLGEPRRSEKVVRQPDRYLGLSEAQIIIPDDGIDDPLTYKQAMNDVDSDQWIKAMDLEMESMYSNSVWTLVDQPSGVRPIGCKWIYKRKRDQSGKVQTFKPRLVNVDEPCVYKRIINSTVAFLVLYVDDILLIGNDVGHLTDIKEWLATQFQMKDLGNAQYNSKKDMLPYSYGIHLSKEQCPKTPQEVEDMSNIPYASAVGSLMYAMLCTRPNICYSVGIVSRYQSNPGRDHWTAVKNILKYLRRTKDYMLVYGSKDLILTRYTDSDFQTDKDVRKSTSGSVFTLNGGAVV